MAILSLTWKSPYVDKTVFILRRGPEHFNMEQQNNCYNKFSLVNLLWPSDTPHHRY